MMAPPLPALAALCAVAAMAHGGAVVALARARRGTAHALAATGQLTLLATVAGLGLAVLGFNEPGAWLPMRADDVLPAAGWLALLIFLLAGHWWRSPGLAVAVPAIVGLLLAASAGLPASVSVHRGLALAEAARPLYGGLGALALALALLAMAGVAARALEERVLDRPALSRRAIAALTTAAAVAATAAVALAAVAWATRGRGAPLWTVQQTWLAAAWLALALAALAAWRRQPAVAALMPLAGLLLVLALVLVPGVGAR